VNRFGGLIVSPFLFKEFFVELKINSPKYGEKIVLIDDEDYERANLYTWHLGYDFKTNNFYVLSQEKGIIKKQKTIRLHRFIMNCPNNKIIDHINRNGLDNRKQNLRICTASENRMNSIKPSHGKTSKYKGVGFYPNLNKYSCRIRINYKLKHIGYFETEKEAALKYNEMAIFYHGKFAKLNEVSI
jgi:hypothetical protein